MVRPSRKRAKKATPEADLEQPDESTTYTVIGICFEQARLKLDSLARVASTSKRARTMVQLFLQQNAGVLLPGICNKASELNRKIMEKPADWAKLVQLVKWFCSMVGRDALQHDVVTLQALLVRKTPPAVVQMLLDAGMRVTHEQLVAAAHQRAEGLEAWVVKPHSDQLPPLTQALCGSNMRELRKLLPALQPSGIPDVLVLAVDLLSPAAAETVLAYIQTDLHKQLTTIQSQLASVNKQQQRRETRRSVQKQLKQHDLAAEADALACRIQQTQQQLESAQLLEKLLVLAVARRHVAVVQRLCQLTAAHGVSAAAMAELLHRAVGHKGPQAAVLDDLMQLMLRSGKQLPGDKVTALLQLAVQRRNSPAVMRLVKQDAAQDLDAAAVLDLLSRSVQLKDGGSADTICSLPAAHQISSQDISALLDTAVRLRSGSLARTLCSLPVTAQISEASYHSLMRSAVEQGATLVLFELARCQAGQRLSPASASDLLMTALTAGPMNDSIIAALCDHLPATAALDREQIQGLLERAVRDSHSMIVQRLIMLHPAVNQLTAADVTIIMYAALEQRIPSCVPYVCHLPAAQFIPIDELYCLLLYGLNLNKAGGVLQIFNSLPMLVQQLEAGQVTTLLRAAMQAGIPALHVVRALTGLPAAPDMSPDDVSMLFQAAMRCQTATDAAQSLMQSAPGLPSDMIEQLVKEAFVLDKGHVGVQLLKLPKAQELEADRIAYLLSVLLEQTKTTSSLICSHRCLTCPETEAVKALCALPKAENIDAAVFCGLVHHIMKMPSRLSCGTTAPQLWLDKLGSLKKAVAALGAVGAADEYLPASAAAGTAAAGNSSPAAAGGDGPTAAAAATAAGSSPPAAAAAAAGGTNAGSSSSSRDSPSQDISLMWIVLNAAAARHPWSLKTVCSWEPAQDLSAREMESLLAQALTPSLYAAPSSNQGTTPLQLLTRLGGCKKLDSDAVARLLLCAVRQGREEAVKYVSRIEPGASGIATNTVIDLLHAAIQLPFGKAVHYVCHLEGAKGMTAADVAEVMKMNEEMGFAFDVNTLRSCLCKAVQQPCGGAHTIA